MKKINYKILFGYVLFVSLIISWLYYFFINDNNIALCISVVVEVIFLAFLYNNY